MTLPTNSVVDSANSSDGNDQLTKMRMLIGTVFRYREKGPGFPVKLIDVQLVDNDYVIELEVYDDTAEGTPGRAWFPRWPRFQVSANRDVLTVSKTRWTCPYVAWELRVM